MDSRLSGRIALITGASSGIGAATALRFANSGARIACADLQSTGIEDEIKRQFGEDRATFVEVSVAEESQIESMVKKAAEWGGRVDIVCNFAGIAKESTSNVTQPHRADDLPTEYFDQTMLINCRGVWLCCKYVY